MNYTTKLVINVNLFLNSDDPGEGDHELQIGAKFFIAVRIASLESIFGTKKHS